PWSRRWAVRKRSWCGWRLRRSIGAAAEGMPRPPGGGPPAGLAGREFKYYLNLIRRARARTKRVVRGYRDADLARSIARTRRNGHRQRLSLPWISTTWPSTSPGSTARSCSCDTCTGIAGRGPDRIAAPAAALRFPRIIGIRAARPSVRHAGNCDLRGMPGGRLMTKPRVRRMRISGMLVGIIVLALAAAAGPARAGWSAPGGALLAPASAGARPLLAIPDGTGGVFAVLAGTGITVQHLDAAGDVVAGWPAAGADVSGGTAFPGGTPCFPQKLPDISATSDGAGGVYVTWGGTPVLTL